MRLLPFYDLDMIIAELTRIKDLLLYTYGVCDFIGGNLPILLFSQQTNVRRSFIMCAVARIGGFGRVAEPTGCRAI